MKTWLAALAFCAIGLVLLLLVVLAPGGHAMEHVIYTWPS